MSDSSQIVDTALAEASMATTTASVRHVSVQTGLPAWALGCGGAAVSENGRVGQVSPEGGAVHQDIRIGKRKSPAWTLAEDEFLREHLGVLSEEEIGRRLGRTPVATGLRWKRDLGLPAPSKTPGYVTARQAGRMLGVDVHAVVRWIDELGILPADTLPFKTPRRVRRIRLSALRLFATRPRNWVYFRPLSVPDPDLARLVARAHALWDDEWLTTGAVADIHGVDTNDVTRAIYLGRLPAVRWNNWRVQRSDAERATFPKGRGSGHERVWPDGADAFLTLARAIGLPFGVIAHLMRWPAGRPSYRLGLLRRNGDIPGLIRRHGLDVAYDQTTGKLWADWRDHRRRFPSLARAMDRLAAGRPLALAGEAAMTRGVMRAWADHCLEAGHPMIAKLKTPMSHYTLERWVDMYRRLAAAGMVVHQ